MGNRPTSDAGRFRSVPERSPDFAHLSLGGLRTYRHTLSAEESRVSYWRRIVQARLDMVRAADSGTAATVDNLRDVFAEARVDSGRTALMRVVPLADDDIPPLPDLAEIWARQPRPGDDAYNHRLAHDLTRAEAQLSAYRTALHKRLAAATGELIARYREQPDLCLSALPRRESARAVSA
jgi:ABC-type transporter Mla subunit MlaD